MAMKTAKKYNPDLILHGNLIRAILSLAIPVVINSFLQTMYNLTDTYWLGKIGTEQLAAINLVTPMQNIITNFGSGITVAGAVLIAQYIGAGEKEDARSMANQIFACAMGFAVVCATLCFLGTPAIVNWLGADGGTAYYARVYLRVVIWDMPFLYMVNIFSAVHQAQGDTVRPMFLNLGGITLNLFLDPFFMIILNLGTAGAALATLLAKAIPAIVAFGLLCRQENDIRRTPIAAPDNPDAEKHRHPCTRSNRHRQGEHTPFRYKNLRLPRHWSDESFSHLPVRPTTLPSRPYYRCPPPQGL